MEKCDLIMILSQRLNIATFEQLMIGLNCWTLRSTAESQFLCYIVYFIYFIDCPCICKPILYTHFYTLLAIINTNTQILFVVTVYFSVLHFDHWISHEYPQLNNDTWWDKVDVGGQESRFHDFIILTFSRPCEGSLTTWGAFHTDRVTIVFSTKFHANVSETMNVEDTVALLQQNSL